MSTPGDDRTDWRAVAERGPATAVLSGRVVTWASPSAHALVGAPAGTLPGRDALELLVSADRPLARRALEEARQGPGTAQPPLRVRAATRPQRRLEVSVHPLDGPLVAVAAWDVTARVRRERELRHRAGHDALTGLPDRALLADRWEVLRSRRPGAAGSGTYVLVCDVDGLKQVNDQHGHAAGDRLLQEVAHALRGHVRPGDTVARTGGDEFVVLVDRVAAEHVEELAARLRGDAPGEAPGPAGARVSVGWAADSPARSQASVLAEADARMYADKRAARERAGGALPAPRLGEDAEGAVRDAAP
ncbi:GGDEF domain-containing protein [Kineococcus arenarius]|uniref:GGDEF domain-containing protein n=1 Tax=Kineococcus sp. SYSU DK007 TaxID=3383128 RepID=UPI003D7E6E8F